MKNLIVGKVYTIHSYKHDGSIHRSWDDTILLESNKDFLVFANCNTKVINSEGKIWYTREPAILYYYKDKWFNIIGQLKEDGLYYYCNIATPTVLEGKYIKYIDYDLDLRVFPDGKYKILDEQEYAYHKKLMNYPEEIDTIVHSELNDLIELVKNKQGPFNPGNVEKYYQKYLEIIDKSKA